MIFIFFELNRMCPSVFLVNYVSAKCIFLSAFIRGVNAVVQIPGPGPGRRPAPHPREDAGHPSRVPDLVPGAILRRVGVPEGGGRAGRALWA